MVNETGLIAGGLFVILLRALKLQAGHWAFENAG